MFDIVNENIKTLKEGLEAEKKSLQEQLERITKPVSVTVMPFEDFMQKRLQLQKRLSNIEFALQEMDHIRTESSGEKWFFWIAEFVIAVWFIYFVVIRTLGENFMSNILPNTGGLDPLMVMSLFEGLLAVAMSALFEKLFASAFNESRRIALAWIFFGSLSLFVFAFWAFGTLI